MIIQELQDQKSELELQIRMLDNRIRELSNPEYIIGHILQYNENSAMWESPPKVIKREEMLYDCDYEVKFNFKYRTDISGGQRHVKGVGDLVTPSQAEKLYKSLGLIIVCVGDDYLYLRGLNE